MPTVIDPAAHAMLDYGVAATFFALGARMMGRRRGAATLVLGVSLFTDYPGGVWRKISFRTHGAMDVVQAAVACLGPVVMGFSNDSEAPTFYGQAASEVGVIAATDWHAQAA